MSFLLALRPLSCFVACLDAEIRQVAGAGDARHENNSVAQTLTGGLDRLLSYPFRWSISRLLYALWACAANSKALSTSFPFDQFHEYVPVPIISAHSCIALPSNHYRSTPRLFGTRSVQFDIHECMDCGISCVYLALRV